MRSSSRCRPARLEVTLTESEAAYVAAVRAPNTRRGYASDWREVNTWCSRNGHAPLPAAPEALSGYITELAETGAKVGTISRRLSSIRFVHLMRDLPGPHRRPPRRRGLGRHPPHHGAPPLQAKPLMLPDLDDVLEACPTTRTFTTRPAEPDLAGLRDRVLLLVGFFSALRRAELAALTVADLSEHPRGRVLSIPRSKTNPYGTEPELVVLPYAQRRNPLPGHRPHGLARHRRDHRRPGTTQNQPWQPRPRPPLHPESINEIVQRAVTRADLDESPWSAHSLRAGHVTYAHQRGSSDRAIAHQTRHRSLATVGTCIRINNAWDDNSATLQRL